VHDVGPLAVDEPGEQRMLACKKRDGQEVPEQMFAFSEPLLYLVIKAPCRALGHCQLHFSAGDPACVISSGCFCSCGGC
jgi:hypothetical protein